VFGLFRDVVAAKTSNESLALTCKTSLTAPDFEPKENSQ
jgi:hypothetical protein